MAEQRARAPRYDPLYDYRIRLRNAKLQMLVAEWLDFGLTHGGLPDDVTAEARALVTAIVGQLLKRKRLKQAAEERLRARFAAYIDKKGS